MGRWGRLPGAYVLVLLLYSRYGGEGVRKPSEEKVWDSSGAGAARLGLRPKVDRYEEDHEEKVLESTRSPARPRYPQTIHRSMRLLR
jgi:hypothetical protein